MSDSFTGQFSHEITLVPRLSLSLFVLRVLTDYSDASLSLDDFALFANRFH